MKIYEIKGMVLGVQDDNREFSVKDKDGNPTGQMKTHRITKIQVLATNADKQQVAVNCSGFDLPATFQLPKIGDTFAAPIHTFSDKLGFPEVGL